jgi:ABC-type lipoprotein export system ATPase subunit
MAGLSLLTFPVCVSLNPFYVLGKMIELRRVTRRYRQGESPVVALNNVDLQIQDKAFVAVVGESGSGKSTLLHLLGGLDKPDEGEILVDGWSLTSANERDLTQYRRTQLGFVFQFFNLLPTLNVLENVGLPLQLQGRNEKESRERALELLEMVGLQHRVRHFVHQLSGGEMQRAAIARALIHRPSLLLADEPTGNLDTENANRVMEAFQWIGEQGLTTLLIATHSSAIAASAHRVIRLANGAVVSDEASAVRSEK